MPIYKISMEEARCGGVFPEIFVPVLMLRHYSRTCWKSEEVIDVEKREDLAL